MENNTTFKQAYLRLKEINEILKNDSIIDVDEIILLQQEAEKLYNFCKSKLEKVERL